MVLGDAGFQYLVTVFLYARHSYSDDLRFILEFFDEFGNIGHLGVGTALRRLGDLQNRQSRRDVRPSALAVSISSGFFFAFMILDMLQIM